jgi:DNA polymerase/3'-5' exonuclease PolX
MRNFEIVRILRNISILLDMESVPFKPRAYEKAAISIEALQEEVRTFTPKMVLKCYANCLEWDLAKQKR